MRVRDQSFDKESPAIDWQTCLDGALGEATTDGRPLLPLTTMNVQNSSYHCLLLKGVIGKPWDIYGNGTHQTWPISMPE